MVRKVTKRKVDAVKFRDFQSVAKNFYEGAKVTYEFEYYQAAELLTIHSAIALADAITVKLLSEKCTGENHYEILNLVSQAVTKDKAANNALKHFKSLVDHKNLISYTGDIYNKRDVNKIMKHFERFLNWTNAILE